jgi:peptide/nickel transport system permease protein
VSEAAVSELGGIGLGVAPVGQDDDVRRGSLWRVLFTTTEGRVGVAVGFAILFVIVFGRYLAPYSPTAIAVGPPASGPSSEHLLGTDGLGRDVLSRFLTGGDRVLIVPLITVTLAYIIGGGLGMLGAYVGGPVDLVIARGFDLLLTLPPLLLVLVVIAGFGSSAFVVVAAIIVIFIPRVGRVIRGTTQAVVANDFIAAAQARGERTRSIIVRELMPNIAGPAIADFALRLTFAIMFVATLSFLGLGTQPPSPAWGLSVADSRGLLSIAPLATLAPAIGIAALAVSSNLIADAFTRHLTRESEGRPVL